MNRLKLPQSPEAVRRRHNTELVTISLSIAALAGCETFDKPDFSNETQQHIVNHNEGLSHAVQKIDGIEDIDQRVAENYISQLPINQEALQDGLQPGEIIIIPSEVK